MQPECLKVLFSYLKFVNPFAFEELTLSNIDIGYNIDDFCEMLQENTNLKRLKIIQCNNMNLGAAKIASALTKHSNISEL